MSSYHPEALAEEWSAIMARAAPQARIIFRSAHAQPRYLDRVSLGSANRRLRDFLQFHEETARVLTRADRVHTYAGFHIADVVSEWPNVRVVEADAATYAPASAPQRVFLSYALTMMPAWRRVVDNAVAMLSPGGLLGVVDFHLPAPAARTARGMRLNAFWAWWFRHDGVHLSAEHLAALEARPVTQSVHEGFAPVPYLPGLRVPYYRFVGRKP